MRILQMIGGLNIGGSQSLVMNLYKAIDRNMVQFDFIIDEPKHTDFAEMVRSMGGKIYVLPKFNGKNLMAVRRAWNQFFQTHREYHILHSHVRSYASIYLPIAKKYGVQTIIHSHSTLNGQGIAAWGKAVLQYPLRFQADYFFACSKVAGEWLFGKRIVAGEKYYLLKNAVNTEQFAFDSTVRTQLRQEFGIADTTVVYGHVGRLCKAKNHLFLLDVFAGIKKRIPDSKLLIVGDGELRDSIAERVQNLGLGHSVILTGPRMDVPACLMAFDCFLFPSLWEGLPVSVVEAQAAGLPCFVSNKVTEEVGFSSLVTYLPVDKGPDIWTETVCAQKLERRDVTNEIMLARFDIQTQAKWIETFYLNLCEKRGYVE